MFFIKVRGDDEEALRMKMMKGVIEKGRPQLWSIPKILVSKKDEMSGLRDFSE